MLGVFRCGECFGCYFTSSTSSQRTSQYANEYLAAAGLHDPQQTVQEQFELVSTRLVNLETGEYVEGMDPDGYDQRKAAKDPSMNRVLSGEEDIA